MSDLEIKRGPGRPPRSEEVKAERRRRGLMGPDRNLKLYVPPDAKDPNFEYRWVNNRPGRVRQLTTQDDWDVVPSDQVDMGTRVVDRSQGDEAILLRKPKEFYEADKKAEQQQLDANDEMMRRGAAQGSEGLTGSEAYVPGGRAGRDGRNIVAGK